MNEDYEEGPDQLPPKTTNAAQSVHADIKAAMEHHKSVRSKSQKTILEKESKSPIPTNKAQASEIATTNICSSTKLLSLHDCLSLGEIEVGLERRRSSLSDLKDIRSSNDPSRRPEEISRSTQEVVRLPYLLRMLTNLRPLSSVQSFVASKSKAEEDEDKEESTETACTRTIDSDELLDRIVDRLEDVAATYSVAGGIDVVTNHLAPSVAKNLSRLPPLRKSRVASKDNDKTPMKDDDLYWITENLAEIARDPIAKRKRRKKETCISSNKKSRHDKGGTDADVKDAASGIDDGLGESSDEDVGEVSMEIEETGNDRRSSLKRRDSMLVAAEDSQESTVIKTLSELASLVVASLDHRTNYDVEGEDDRQQHSGAASGGRRASSLLSLNTDDMLSEKATSISSSGRLDGGDVGGGSMEGNDLSSTIVAIMYNAPVLQSRHVANAFCRASLPQTGDLISRLGANCPASVPSLLLGCIDAYSMSIDYHYRDDNDGIYSSNGNSLKAILSCSIVSAVKSAIVAIARLSKTESCRVRNRLQSLGVMIDMQLKLTMEEAETGMIATACLLTEHLSFPISTNHDTVGTDSRTNISSSRTKLEDAQKTTNANIHSAHDEFISEYITTSSQGSEPSLIFHFFLNPEFYLHTLDFFSQTMVSPTWLSGAINESIGKWSLVLRAYALLLLVPLPESSIASDNVPCISYKKYTDSFSSLLRNFGVANKHCRNGSDGNLPKRSKMDTLVGLLSSCAVLLLSLDDGVEDWEGDHEKGETVQRSEILQTTFNILRSTSEQSDMLRMSFEDEIRKEDTWGVFKRVLYPLASIDESYANNSYRSKRMGLGRVCEEMRPVFEDMKIETKLETSFNITFRLHALRRGLQSPTKELKEDTKRFLNYILHEEDEDCAVSFMKNAEFPQFVVEATNFLVKPGSSEFPLVLPAQLDMAWSRISSSWDVSESKPTDGRRCNFLFRLLYSFIFLDKSPLSPFAFDPRSSPIKESIMMIQNIPLEPTRNYILSEIQVLTRKHCLESVPYRLELRLGLRESRCFDVMDRKKILAALRHSIRAHLHEKNAELSENTTEQLFVQAKARICNSDVYSTVTNAFLSSSHEPSKTYSYSLLCRDPIVCLKFPLSVWKRRSLRRIALSVLENFLTSNNAITLEQSRLLDTAFELLVARDAIVVRCLLAILHGGDSEHLVTCSMTTSFVRWMIQSRPGLIALIVKQGLHERDLDWLVENVPETMNDSRYLLQIFSERNSMTAAERLVAADAVIRIAIVHGQASEVETGQLILTAVSQLVDSFYLILGPVGLLPVDALFNTVSGTPITQTSQKAAFRILKAMAKLKGTRNQLRRDCSMFLQKFVSLCKGELQGAVQGRRKQLIKELYEAAVKLEK